MNSASLTKRQFLKHSTALLGLGVLSASEITSVRAATKTNRGMVGSQLYGWGQYYSKSGKNLENHLGEVLSALRDAGYDYAEGSMDLQNLDKNGRFADQLKSKGLRPLSLYTGGRLHEDGPSQRAVELIVIGSAACQRAGFTIINCNPDPIGREKTDVELKRQAEAIALIGKELRKLNMSFGIHNHTPEMLSGGREFHYNLRKTPSRDVGFCYDVDWVFRGGVQPKAAMTEYGSRVVSWHLRQNRAGVWWEDLDEGDIDYSEVAALARSKRSARFYTVELALETGTKITRDVVQNHARSRAYVKRTFGV